MPPCQAKNDAALKLVFLNICPDVGIWWYCTNAINIFCTNTPNDKNVLGVLYGIIDVYGESPCGDW